MTFAQVPLSGTSHNGPNQTDDHQSSSRSLDHQDLVNSGLSPTINADGTLDYSDPGCTRSDISACKLNEITLWRY